MNVTVVLDHKFLRDNAGNYFAGTMFGNTFWDRYLRIFDQVFVISRAKSAEDVSNLQPIENPQVHFQPVPYYEGPTGFARNFLKIRRHLETSLAQEGAVILRVPQILPTLASSILNRIGKPYGVEVVGDPWDVYSPGAESHPLRPVFRRYFSSRLRAICRKAATSCYVTESSLQKRYPPRLGTYSTHASSVELTELVSSPRTAESFSAKEPRLLFVGALNRLYKGQDVLLRAVSILKGRGVAVQLTVVGDGQYRDFLEKLAESLGIGGQVKFLGQIPSGGPVFSLMDRSDLYVLPSRQEGLARSVLEALSRGLPAIASHVGGMPEVLPECCLVESGDNLDLADRIEQLTRDPSKLANLSRTGLETAIDFLADNIEPRRDSFFVALKQLT